MFLIIVPSSHFVSSLKCKLNHYLKSRAICEIVITNIYNFMWMCHCIIQNIFSKNVTFETFRGEYHCAPPPEENNMLHDTVGLGLLGFHAG